MSASPEKPNTKEKICETDQLLVSHHGVAHQGRVDIFIFQDVVDELLFAAQKMDSAGILCGSWCICEQPKHDDEPREYIEIASYRDVYPMKNGLQYAAMLRRSLGVTNSTEMGSVLGLALLSAATRPVSFEDVLLMRTYFNLTYQVCFMVDADKSALSCYYLTESGQFEETGFYIVSLKQ